MTGYRNKKLKTPTAAVVEWSTLGNNYAGLKRAQNTARSQRGQVASRKSVNASARIGYKAPGGK